MICAAIDPFSFWLGFVAAYLFSFVVWATIVRRNE
jgi:hypothetical protein